MLNYNYFVKLFQFEINIDFVLKKTIISSVKLLLKDSYLVFTFEKTLLLLKLFLCLIF